MKSPAAAPALGCCPAQAGNRSTDGPLSSAYGASRRLGLILVTVLPPFVFFAWSQEHLKVFAYVPLLNRFVVPLGYRSVFALGADALYPDPNFLDHLVPFAKRYIFWLVATMAVSAAWIVARARSGDATQIQLPIPARFIGALALYTLL